MTPQGRAYMYTIVVMFAGVVGATMASRLGNPLAALAFASGWALAVGLLVLRHV